MQLCSSISYDCDMRQVREVRERMRAAGIPQDVQTLDIDYMDRNQDFTFDPVAWPDLPQLIEVNGWDGWILSSQKCISYSVCQVKKASDTFLLPSTGTPQ